MPDSTTTQAEAIETKPNSRSKRTNPFAKMIKFRAAILFGLLSATLYSLLYYFYPNLISLAQSVQQAQSLDQGQKALFFIPILLALVFSVIHGAFTAHFWDALGVKAKKAN